MRERHAYPRILNPLGPALGDLPEHRVHLSIEPLTPLFGREDDLQAVHALLADGGVRLVTLAGPPGVGKTRLAFALFASWQQETADTVAFVPLSAVTDAPLVLPTIAYGLGVSDEGTTPLVERIAATLGGEPTL
ncbi:MAG TPA: ATP-binding protein, partial [Nitrolancea sp.]|nr:ATP-binding protein [Nitrolancea sp.]